MSVRISRVPTLRKSVVKEGVLEADGTEQTLVEVVGAVSLEGYVDLGEMGDGDEVVLRRYVKIQGGGEYGLHASDTYSGVQREPLVRFPPITCYYGLRITLQQTAGTYRRFPHQFFILL